MHTNKTGVMHLTKSVKNKIFYGNLKSCETSFLVKILIMVGFLGWSWGKNWSFKSMRFQKIENTVFGHILVGGYIGLLSPQFHLSNIFKSFKAAKIYGPLRKAYLFWTKKVSFQSEKSLTDKMENRWYMEE